MTRVWVYLGVAALVAAGVAVTTVSPAAAAKPAPVLPAVQKANQTIVIKKDSVIGIKIEQAIQGETAHVDDKVVAKVSRDVVVDGVTAIPAGTRLEGVITHIERTTPATKGKIGLRFTTLVQADNTKVSMQTDVIFREGEPITETTPAFNTSSGFGALVTDRMQMALRSPTAARGTPTPVRYRDARLPEGSLLTVQLTAPLSLTIHRETP